MGINCLIWLPPAARLGNVAEVMAICLGNEDGELWDHLMRRILAVKPITMEALTEADTHAAYKLKEDSHAQ